MLRRSAGVAVLGFWMAACGASIAQEGPAEKIGEKIDRGVNRLTENIRESWADVRRSVEKLGIEGRVYSRLHWDKALNEATIDIEVRDANVVVLKGSVANASARAKAVQLAQDTIGVKKVVDKLAIAP